MGMEFRKKIMDMAKSMMLFMIVHHRAVSGLHRLPRHDGLGRRAVQASGSEDLRQYGHPLSGQADRHEPLGAPDHDRGGQEVFRRGFQRLEDR